MNLNKAELIGNLSVDPAVKSLPSGQSIASFRLATNYIWRDAKTKEKKEKADFHSVVAWGRLADVIQKYLKKGDKVYIDGRLQNRTWDGKDGKKHYVTEIVAQNLIMLGGAKRKSEKKKKKVNDEVIVEEVDLTKAEAQQA